MQYTSLGLLLSGLAACCPDVDQKLNNQITAWAPYQENQVVSFQNERQDSVVFRARRRQHTEIGYEQVCGSYDIETAETILVHQADTAFQFKIALTQEVLVKLDSYYRQPPAPNVAAMFNSVAEKYVSFDWRDRYLSEITLNGQLYRNVLHIYGNNVPNALSFGEIYYAKEQGLVAFSNAAGWFYRR